MKLQLRNNGSSLSVAGLAACVLGLVLCPYAYIAIGALSGFAPVFSFVSLPPLLIASGYLLFRFLSKPVATRSPPVLVAAEIASGIVIVAFIVLISGFTLITRFERVGLSCVLFQIASIVSLPGVLIRTTALQQRLKRVPNGVVKLTLIAIVFGSTAVALAYLIHEPHLI